MLSPVEAEVGVNVAGCIAAVGQAEADRRLRWFSRNSALAVSTGFNPVLHRLRHSYPVVHQLEVEGQVLYVASP